MAARPAMCWERIARTRGLRVAPSLVRKLADYGILKTAE